MCVCVYINLLMPSFLFYSILFCPVGIHKLKKIWQIRIHPWHHSLTEALLKPKRNKEDIFAALLHT